MRLRTIIDKREDYWGAPGLPNWRASRDQAGGGVLLMNTIHQLDTLRYITGLNYTSAQGTIATFRAVADVEDAGSAVLRLSNGAIVSVVASAHSPGANHEETIEIDGTHGRLDLPDPFGIAPLRIYKSETKVWNEIAVVRPDSHLLMIESFVDAIVKDKPEPAGAEDAAAAIATVNAIYRSAQEGAHGRHRLTGRLQPAVQHVAGVRENVIADRCQQAVDGLESTDSFEMNIAGRNALSRRCPA